MKLLRFLNRQKTRRPNLPLLRQVGRHLLETSLDLSQYELGVHLVGAEEMARLNETFLGHDGSTDVITFNHQEAATPGTVKGEIFISIDDAVAQAKLFRATWQSEVVRYIAHGTLHLLGYDDKAAGARRKMKRVENSLVKELSRRFDLGRLDVTKNVSRAE
jgi:probable rRNA maturation factor